jgi:hypothetical protein
MATAMRRLLSDVADVEDVGNAPVHATWVDGVER